MSLKVLIPNNPAEHDPRTRDHIQKVARLLNDLVANDSIGLDSNGDYSTSGGGGNDPERVLTQDTTVKAGRSRFIASPLELGDFTMTIEATAVVVVI